MSRNRLQLDERRRQLLEVGKALFSERPFDALSASELAKAAGVSSGLLYHYFGSKRGYYIAVVGALADELLEVTRLDPNEPFEGGLTRGLEGFYAFVAEREGLFRALVRSGVGSDSEVDQHVERVRASIISQVVMRLDVDPDDPQTRWRLRAWVGAVESLALEIASEPELTVDAFVNALTETLVALLMSSTMASK